MILGTLVEAVNNEWLISKKGGGILNQLHFYSQG